MAKGISLHVGVNQTNAPGISVSTLKGCEKDAQAMHNLAHVAGFDAMPPLLGADATFDRVFNTIAGVAPMKAGDIFLFTFSGHGTRRSSDDPTETDGKDESIVLSDKIMTDNVFRRQLWPMFGTGVRVLGISDSCRSGTVLYTLALNLANTPGLFLDDSVVAEIRGTNPFARTSVTLVEDRIKVRFHELPSYQVEAHYHQESAFYSSIREALPKDPPPLEAKLLTLSACADDEVTADGPENSAFTAALLKVWNNGSFQGNYDKFLEAIGAELPNQTPQRNPKAPNVDMNFVNQRPFTI